ncbi:MAG: 2OG-Fe(II) oxygenase [Candidatus Competibacteraceae bacterium]|nr:2OG-Fe(II) oxygenase [Candidatus Competibacteraceae bacterium]
MRPTPIHDQSSLSVLFYDKPGDHIGWHYDHNFYRGRHFTVLLPVVNEGHGEGGLSHATLKAMIGTAERTVATPPNTLVVFEGARVNHKVTPVAEGERRLVVSMSYCTDGRASLAQGVMRRIKDIAFFGPPRPVDVRGVGNGRWCVNGHGCNQGDALERDEPTAQLHQLFLVCFGELPPDLTVIGVVVQWIEADLKGLRAQFTDWQ